MNNNRNYSGWTVLNRSTLLDALEGERFTNVVCEHVTFRYPDRSPAPPVETMKAVGHVVGDGVEAVIVEVDGSVFRPDGSVFHVTVSLADGHRPVESNPLVCAAVATASFHPIDVTLDAAAF